MQQGAICKIKQRNLGQLGDIGWFQKLRDENNAIRYFPISTNVPIDPLSDSSVDDSLSNAQPNRQYEVVFVLPVESQIELVARVMDLGFEKRVMKTVFGRNLTTMIHSLEERRDAAQAEVQAISSELQEARRIQKDIDLVNDPGFTYVYGRHPADHREFAWRVPFAIADQANVGARAVVETVNGDNEIVVTRVEKSPSLLKHKLVVRFL